MTRPLKSYEIALLQSYQKDEQGRIENIKDLINQRSKTMKETKEQKIKKLEKKLRQVKVQIDELSKQLEEAKIRQAGLVREMMGVANGQG